MRLQGRIRKTYEAAGGSASADAAASASGLRPWAVPDVSSAWRKIVTPGATASTFQNRPKSGRGKARPPLAEGRTGHPGASFSRAGLGFQPTMAIFTICRHRNPPNGQESVEASEVADAIPDVSTALRRMVISQRKNSIRRHDGRRFPATSHVTDSIAPEPVTQNS